MQWEAVTAVTGLIGFVCMGGAVYVRYVVRTEIAAAMEKMNGRYLYSAGSRITGHEIERRLDAIEER